MSELNNLAADVFAVCHKRKWSTHWESRGVQLHLESSELIEAVRGKGNSTPLEEAGDVLTVLMSFTESLGIPFDAVVESAKKKTAYLLTAPRYAGEQFEQD